MSTAKRESIQPEYEDNEFTGLEVEDIGDEKAEGMKPWDPQDIRVDPKMFSLRNIMDMIKDEELTLTPEFQRRRVWPLQMKVRLIESLLLRIPLPSFYFDSDQTGLMQVVDGLQRLSTIYEFVEEDAFVLDGLEYLQEGLGGKRFSDLGQTWKRRIYQTQMSVNVIDPQTPGAVKFNIFKRINTGGKPLNAQEIRHAMSKARSRELLSSLADEQIFHEATGGAVQDHKRMADLEIVLRYCAFHMLEDFEAYNKFPTMAEFLTDFTQNVDDGHISDEEIEQLKIEFRRSMENALNLFGEHAFRKWSVDSERKNPVNRALFESWSVALAGYRWEELEAKKTDIVEAARSAMTDNSDYIDAISVSTGSGPRVACRFEMARSILKQVRSQ